MPGWEAMIFNDAAINAETDALEIVAPTSATVRDASFGKAQITHAMVLASTNDIDNAYITWPGQRDSNGVPIPFISVYGATASFDLARTRLPKPIPVPPNAVITPYATSQTAANTVTSCWLRVEYSEIGGYEAISKAGSYTQREIDAGGALTTQTQAAGTALTSTLQSERAYQVAGIYGTGVDGSTAGIVGPAFVKFVGPSGYSGLESWIPLANGGSYVADGETGFTDLEAAGITQPKFKAPCPLTPWFLSYTAERPTARVVLAVDQN